MKTLFSNRDKAIIIGLYLSKFDMLVLSELGLDGHSHAFNVLGYAIGAKPASIKNYRDEFDPYFPNNRKGWHKRPLRQHCKNILEMLSELNLSDFTDLIKSFIISNYDIEKNIAEIDKTNISESIAKRLATGVAAEEYFKLNYTKINEFFGYDILDTRMLACGFDFKLSLKNDFYYVEVKGINLNVGSIVMTKKEFSVADQLQEKYCLFVVRNFKENPTHMMVFNPVNSFLEFKKNERKVVQVDYSAILR